MNKYQEYLLNGDIPIWRCCPLEEGADAKNFYGKFDKTADTFTITQDKDINLVEYSLIIMKHDFLEHLERVDVWINGAWEELAITEIEITTRGEAKKFPCYRINVDFRNRIDKIRFRFKGGLIDDYIMKLQYVEADKEAYYAEQAKLARENLIKVAAIKHSTGNDLVNIYFQPCCDEYQRTEITLYHDGQMLGKYKVDAETFFKSITGLAYGTYEYVLKQFGKDDKMLLESDKIEFTIESAVSPYGGKGLVYWN